MFTWTIKMKPDEEPGRRSMKSVLKDIENRARFAMRLPVTLLLFVMIARIILQHPQERVLRSGYI